MSIDLRAFRFSMRLVVALLATLVLLKLWLIHGEEIAGSATRHDALWFVRSAQHWYWGATYDWTSFIRPPAYPIWLAVTHAVGVRQRLAIELLQLGGFLTLTFALMRSGLPPLIAVCGFAAAAFHPGGFQLNDYTMADPFYAAVLPFVLAGMILSTQRGGTVAAVLTGFALAVLWLTREESVLVALLICVFLALWFFGARADGSSWRQSARRIFRPALTLLGVLIALVLLIYTANQRTFRAFAKSDMTSPSFEAAFKALVRIKPEQHQRFVPVPRESLERAFAVSPTFARLKPAFDGDTGEPWRIETQARLGIPGEIGINWLLWAIRHAASVNGIHDSPWKAEQFYLEAAREINEALDAGRVPKRFLWASFIGPNLFPEAHQLPRSLLRLLNVFILRYEMTPLADDEILLPEERALYDTITLRRPPASAGAAATFPGALKNFLGAYHRAFVVALATFGTLAAGTLLFSARRVRLDPLNIALLLLGFAIVSRLALFTVIDATSWPVAYERFLYPVMPLTSSFLVAVIYQAWRVFSRRASTPG